MISELTWQAADIVRALSGQCLHEQSWSAHGVSIDSRTVKPGDLFVALKGPTHDGHEHVAAAISAGAVAAIVSRQPPQTPPQAPLIFVDDTFHALEQLGRAGRARAAASIIAVTGSVGKTSTKEMLRRMLSATGSTYANEGSLNNHWGVPLSLARLPADARYGVFEMGMNHAGELTALSAQVRPHVALITTIEAVHLEHFASVDAIADAKAEIFSGMAADGIAVLNRDNGQQTRLAAAAKAYGLKKILGFGYDSKCDARIIEWTPVTDGSDITAEILGRTLKFHLGAPGQHLVLNALGALLTSAAAGSDVEACAAALAHYQQPRGRGVIENVPVAGGTITVIDESYNASPVSVRSAIKVLGQRAVSPGSSRILALGDMKELGDQAPTLHAALAEDIVAAKIDRVFCCGEMMKHLYDALPDAIRGAYKKDSAALAPLVIDAAVAGDILTVKGSHSMQMEKIIQAFKNAVPSMANKQAI